MALADYQALVPQLVRDTGSVIATGDRDEAIARAAAQYAKDRPRLVVADVTWPGGALADVPAGWSAGFSSLVTIEYPIGEAPPALIDGEAFRTYASPSATKLQLDDQPAAGAVLRVTFTARHQLDGSGDTIPADDREPVACWAAAFLLDQLAAKFSGDKLTTIASDSVDHQSKGRDYAARAAALRKRYFNGLGIDPERLAPAGVVVQTRPKDSLGQTQRLTHPGRWP